MLSAARSCLLLRPTRTLRHSRAENRCERLRAAYSTMVSAGRAERGVDAATTAAPATQPHEPQNRAAATTGAASTK
jgi:hypothetical protein